MSGTDGPVSRSRSSEAIRKTSMSSTCSGSVPLWRRSRSLSDTQKVLDEAIRNLEEYMNAELTLDRHRHYSSNDSAMGESETVLSPVQQASVSEPSTLSRNRQVYTSMDSAFSNNSSPTNSSEGMNAYELDSPFDHHTRMSSGISAMSGVSSISPTPGYDSPQLAASPQLGRKGPLCSPETKSLPALSPERDAISESSKDSSTAQISKTKKNWQSHSAEKSGKFRKKKKVKQVPSVSAAGTFSPQRSPILSSSKMVSRSEPQLDNISSDHTPTESTTNINISVYSWDSNYVNSDDGTII